METLEKKIASAEFIAEMLSRLPVVFYETPEPFFNALAKTVLHLKLTEDEVTEMVNEAIFGIRKTKITIAEVINGREKKQKTVDYYTFS